MCLQLVFHVSLYFYHALSPPPLVEPDKSVEYKVKTILDSKGLHNNLYYLVDWLGITLTNQTWELVEDLFNATKHVVEFHHRSPNKAIPCSCIVTYRTHH